MRVAPVVVNCTLAPAPAFTDKRQTIATQQAARNVVEMSKSGAVGERKGAHDAQRRLLRAGGENRAARCGVARKVERQRRPNSARRDDCGVRLSRGYRNAGGVVHLSVAGAVAGRLRINRSCRHSERSEEPSRPFTSPKRDSSRAGRAQNDDAHAAPQALKPSGTETSAPTISASVQSAHKQAASKARGAPSRPTRAAA